MVVLFGLVAAILVTVQVYLAYMWWEHFQVGQDLAPTREASIETSTGDDAGG